jgi:glutamyl-tRNA synthetase
VEKALSSGGGRGVRFAPSPTGTFHVGNLRTAWISHKLSRAWNQPWIVRFEDIDRPRVISGAQDSQLEDMAALGLEPDECLVQSMGRGRHWEVFEKAVRAGRIYPCFCSRKDVRDALDGAASAPHPGSSAPHPGLANTQPSQPIYSGHCRSLGKTPAASEHGLPSLAWRFAVEEDPGGRSDFIVARTSPTLPADFATFVPAYHLACAIDDWDGKYHTLVRAADLAEVVPQHRAIMKWHAKSENKPYFPPAVFKAAVVTQNVGHSLEKRTQGVTLTELQAGGWSPERLVELFKKSWDESLVWTWAQGKVFGEARSVLTLKDLGL